MAKKVADSVLDGGLDKVLTSTVMFVTDAEPADRAAAVSASLIGTHTVVGSITKGDTAGGRLATIPQQTDVSITTTGDANHVCIADGTELLVVTTTSSTQGLSSGGTVTIPSFTYTVNDPT